VRTNTNEMSAPQSFFSNSIQHTVTDKYDVVTSRIALVGLGCLRTVGWVLVVLSWLQYMLGR